MNMLEIWKDIKGYEGLYQVSNTGKIYSNKSNRLLNGRIEKKGYRNVVLYKDNSSKCFKVHRLVAEAFIPNPDNLPQVNHKNENKLDNRVENLEWCDNKYNSNYGTRTQRSTLSHINKEKKCKPVIQYDLNGKYVNLFPSSREVERQLGYPSSNIRLCCKGFIKKSHGYIWRYAS